MPGLATWARAWVACAVLLAAAPPGAAQEWDATAWRAEADRVRLMADNDPVRAHEAALALRARLPAAAMPADHARSWNLLARTEVYLARTDAAAEHAGTALALATRHDDRIGQAEAHLNVALNAINQGRIDAVVDAARSSMSVLEGVQRPDLLGEAMLRTAMVYRRLGQLEESVTLAMQAMEIARQSRHPLALAYAHHGVAISFDLSGRLTEATHHYEQMRGRAREAGSRLLETYATLSLGSMASRGGEHARARALIESARDSFRALGMPYSIGFATFALADDLKKQGRCMQALPLIDEVAGIYTRWPNRIGLWHTLNLRSDCLKTLDRLAEARQDAGRAHELARGLRFKPYLSESAHRLGVLTEAAGEHREAARLLIEAADLAAQVASEKSSTRMSQLAQRYEAELKQREIDELSRSNARQRQELEQRALRQDWLIAVLGGSLLLLGMAGAFLLRLRRAHGQLQLAHQGLRRSEDEVRRLNIGLEQRVHERTAALRQQARYLRTLIDMLPMGAWFKDTRGRYLVCNQAHADALGHHADELVGAGDAELLPPGSPPPAAGDPDEEVLRSGRRCTVEQQVATFDGTRWVEVYRAPVRDDDGSLLGMVGVSRDISERKAVEAAREAALAESRRLAQLRSDFLAQMSHELRTPLNGILGFAQLLATEESLTPPQARKLDIIVRSAEHLMLLINDLLDLSRIDAGRMELHPQAIDLASYLQTTADIVHMMAQEKRIAFRMHLQPELPAAVVADGIRLRQVLLNLLANAVRFTDAGIVEFNVSCGSEAVPGSRARVRFEVADTGVGMTEAQMARLFRPFEQVGDSGRRAGGVGLGLAISRQLAGLMGGHIDVRSEPGRGSRFWLELTLEVAPRGSAAPAVPTSRQDALRLRVPGVAAAPLLPPQALAEAPSEPALQALLHLAQLGNMRAVCHEVDELQRSDARFADFANHLKALAESYRSQAVKAYIEAHLGAGAVARA